MATPVFEIVKEDGTSGIINALNGGLRVWKNELGTDLRFMEQAENLTLNGMEICSMTDLAAEQIIEKEILETVSLQKKDGGSLEIHLIQHYDRSVDIEVVEQRMILNQALHERQVAVSQ